MPSSLYAWHVFWNAVLCSCCIVPEVDLLLSLPRLGTGHEVGCREIRVDKSESLSTPGLESPSARVIWETEPTGIHTVQTQGPGDHTVHMCSRTHSAYAQGIKSSYTAYVCKDTTVQTQGHKGSYSAYTCKNTTMLIHKHTVGNLWCRICTWDYCGACQIQILEGRLEENAIPL